MLLPLLQNNLLESTTDVTVSASVVALSLTAFSPTVITPTVVDANSVSLTLTSFNPTITVGVATEVSATAVSLSLTTYGATVDDGITPAVLPGSAFLGLIENEAASINPAPDNYEICQRSGFRVPRGTLVKDGYGYWVRPESADQRHPQEFVRSRPEDQQGSRSPEQEDTFVDSIRSWNPETGAWE